MMRGCDDLRAWLEAQGFKTAPDSFSNRDNLCNWYTYRRSAIPARECETNERKTMQLVVKPSHYDGPGLQAGHRWQSAGVDVTGEAGGVWFKLSAYSLKQDALHAKLPQIEASLIAAWNALHRDGAGEQA